MKKTILCFCLFISAAFVSGQNIGIGTSTPHANALLEISSTNKGLLLPRLADTNAVTGSKPAGLMIYSNSDNQLYFYNGIKWQSSAAASADSLWYLRNDSILYTQKKYVGIRTNPAAQPPTEGLQVNGNLLVQQELSFSNTTPTAGQTITMDNNPGIQSASTDSVNRILDPGGAGAYTNNNQGNVRILSALFAPVGYKISFQNNFQLAIGDTLWISRASYAFGGNLNYLYRFTETSTLPADLFIPHIGSPANGIFFLFRSNGDGQNGSGFDIIIRKIYSNSTPAAAPLLIGNSLYFDRQRGALFSGLLPGDYTPGDYSASLGNSYAAGGYAFAAGVSQSTQPYAFSGGSSRATGLSSTALGNSYANGVESVALGNSSSNGFGALAAGSSGYANADYSVALGYQPTTNGYASVALGNTISNAAYGITLGRFNDTLVTRETLFNSGNSNSPVLIVGNGGDFFSRSNALTILRSGNVGIGNIIPQTRLHVQSAAAEAIRIEGPTPYVSLYDGAVLKGYVQAAGAAFELGSKNSLPIDFYTSDTRRLTILGNGNTGINEPNPTARFQVNGFTRLGSTAELAPAIKMKELSLNSPAIDGGIISTPHGLTASKIISITATLEYTPNAFVTAGFRPTAGYEYGLTYDAFSVYITNMPGNSSNILNKPVKIMITYKE